MAPISELYMNHWLFKASFATPERSSIIHLTTTKKDTKLILFLS